MKIEDEDPSYDLTIKYFPFILMILWYLIWSDTHNLATNKTLMSHNKEDCIVIVHGERKEKRVLNPNIHEMKHLQISNQIKSIFFWKIGRRGWRFHLWTTPRPPGQPTTCQTHKRNTRLTRIWFWPSRNVSLQQSHVSVYVDTCTIHRMRVRRDAWFYDFPPLYYWTHVIQFLFSCP